MMTTPSSESLSLQEKIERQQKTVEALKRDGHVHDDAERQLKQMIAELHGESLPRAS